VRTQNVDNSDEILEALDSIDDCLKKDEKPKENTLAMLTDAAIASGDLIIDAAGALIRLFL